MGVLLRDHGLINVLGAGTCGLMCPRSWYMYLWAN